jgi:hypothetical protein
MRPRVAFSVLIILFSASLAVRTAFAQVGYGADAQGNANLQNLLAALVQGTTVTLYTPLANGLLQVTTFEPPLALPRPQAEAAIAIARQHLAALDIPYPTADQFARALVGGTIPGRDGPMQLPGVLPATGKPATVRSEILLPNGLPQVATTGAPRLIAPPAPMSAAAGGSAPAAITPQARELALQQLAGLGIVNPSEAEIRTAVYGGTLATMNGVYQFPGITQR